MTDPNAPAYPAPAQSDVCPGLTIRQHAILMMAQGLAANPRSSYSDEGLARDAINIADAVLKKMGQEETKP